METLSAVPSGTFGIVVIGIVVGMGIISLMLSSWSLQLANNFCGGTEAGFFRCALGVVLSAALSAGFMLLAAFLEPDGSPWGQFCYGALGAVLGIALALFQNPLRAVGTYFMYCVIGMLLHLFIFAFLAIGAYFAVPSHYWKELADQANTVQTADNPLIQNQLKRLTAAKPESSEVAETAGPITIDAEAVKLSIADALDGQVDLPQSGSTPVIQPVKKPARQPILPPNVSTNPFVK